MDFLKKEIMSQNTFHSLQSYDTVFMGRKTYEFGYDYGLQPGKLPYAHMKHYVFSKSIDINPDPGLNIIRTYKKEIITGLKAEEGTDIYLCGGGTLAGWCLENELIDSLILKLNPVMFGKGIPLFGPVKKHVKLELNGSKQYQNGVLLLTYRIKYK